MTDADPSRRPRSGNARPAAPDATLPNGAGDAAYFFTPDTIGRFLDTLAATIGAVPCVLLPDTEEAHDASPLVQPSSPEIPAPADRSARVQLLGEIARGGMGAILKGRDHDLGRDLAVKVLLDAHRGSPELVRRFVEEAQIAGQLQHPGIVPVYELGCFADGRPYFTMKLVKGRTLAQLLAARPVPGSERARFLGIFEQVAQTVAYAHARGVIHRDLKPSNVMVGSFGEVQVMDWGLAKVLRRGGAADDASAGHAGTPVDETVIATARSGSEDESDLSRAGSVLGTPSYMAPEQAQGDVEAVDERADVFALGSILCEILTGGPAFTGRNSGEIQRRAARADLADAAARLSACGADGDLASLARACLAPGPEDRPRDAGVVASRLGAYLAGVQERLHAAELAHAAEEARAEEALRTAEAAEARSRAERRARRLTAVLAASAVLMTAVGAGGWAWVRQQRAARGLATAREVDAALREATIAWGRARAAPVGDLQAWGEAVAAAKRAESILSLGAADEEAAKRTRATVAALLADRDAAVARAEATARDRRLLERLAAIHARLGDTLDRREAERDYVAAFREADIDVDRLPPAEAAARIAARPGRRELTAALDEWIHERRNLVPPDLSGARQLLDIANAADPDPWGRRLREAIVNNQSDTLRQLADSVDPLDLPLATVERLAEALRSVAGDPARSARLLRPLVRANPGDFWLNWDLGASLAAIPPDGHEQALPFYVAAVAIRPQSAIARDTLGVSYWSLGRREDALFEFREAIRVAPDDRRARINLARLLAEWGQGDRAFAEFAEVIRRSPHPVEIPGDLLQKLQQTGQGEKLIEELRADVRRRPGDAAAHASLGYAMQSQGRNDEAIAAFREALRLKPEPLSYFNLGMALERKSSLEEAIDAHRRAARLDGEHVGEAIFQLARLLRRVGRADEATAVLRQAAELARREGRPEVVKKAETALENASGTEALAWFQLGLALERKNSLVEAVAAYRDAVKLDGEHLGDAIFRLADLLGRLGRYDEAADALRRAAELARGEGRMDQVKRAEDDLATVSRRKLLSERLPAFLAGEDRPKGPEALADLTWVCYARKHFAAGVRLCEAAFRADPKLADDPELLNRHNAACLAALAGCGEGADAPRPDDAERARLRGLSLSWQRDQVAAWRARMKAGGPEARLVAARKIDDWRADTDLDGVRLAASLAKLPRPEQDEWRNLWAEVETLRAEARGENR